MTRMPIAATSGARRAEIMRTVDDWMGRGNFTLRLWLACFLIGLPIFFTLNMLIFWLQPGLPFWGVLAFTFGTSFLIAAMNAFFAWASMRH